MNVSSVSTDPGGALQPAAQSWPLTSPVGAAPRRVFRRVIYLRLATGGETADRLVVEEGATSLEGSFVYRDYNARNPEEPSLAANLAASGNAVIVTLDAPRQARTVRLTAGTAPASGSTLELCRVDGNALSEQPTVSVSVAGTAATLTEDFTDLRFALRLRGAAGPLSLATAAVAEIDLRSYPLTPRLGIAPPEAPDSALFFWQASGEIGKGVPSSQGEVDAGATLATELQRYLDRFWTAAWESYLATPSTPLPVTVDVALVIESDAPCIFNLTAFQVGYHFILESFPSHEEKQVLRFPGDRLESGEIPIQIPANATVLSATLQAVESFRRDRPAVDEGGPTLEQEVTETVGVHLDGNSWAAQRVTPSQALAASGIALALMPLASKAELLVEIQEDWHGRPSGKKVAGGTIQLEAAGWRGWATLLFPEFVTLSTRSYWLLVKAASRQAVWLARSTADADPVRVLERSDPSGAWDEKGALKGLEALYQLFSRGSQARQQPAAALSLGPHSVGAAGGDGDLKTFDLGPAVIACLADEPGGSARVSLPLTFVSAVSGILTVYPPLIEYDL